ncbi:MAG TPA: magnesium-translocating P-type ATPase [Oscillatoriaceae cyanobacterium]
MTVPFWLEPLEALERRLDSGPGGLTSAEAAARLARFGRNVTHTQREAGALMLLWAQFTNPLVAILLVATAASAAFGETLDAAIIAVMIALSIGINFVQTLRSQRAAERLRRSVATRAFVLRDGTLQELPWDRLVPGDVFALAAGDVVPADGRLLEARDLHVDQASLTGESFPVEKQPGALDSARRGLDEADNSVFAGTSIVSGSARALAVRTGTSTAIGAIAGELAKQPPPTEFERGMAGFATLILRVIVVLVLFVFTALALFRHDPLQAFLFAVALAVGLTPEFLPMILTVTLSQGALRMAAKGVVVKQLQAIENLGSVTVLCCDKTGTLTEGNVVLERYVDASGADCPAVLAAAVLNSTYETGIRSHLDAAILRAPHPQPEPCRKLDELPFDFQRRRLSVVLLREGLPTIITKGAPEAVLAVCDTLKRDGATVPLDAAGRAGVEATFRALSEEGFHVLALAERAVDERPAYSVADERDMTFLGFAAFLDPPRADVRDTLSELAGDGIRIVVLTGDNEWITRHICAAVGLPDVSVVLGTTLDETSAEALPRLVEKTQVFARMTPAQKLRVVHALKARGDVVGFLGDGINDAPSLRMADVGISVESGTDVAKEAAPIILMEKSLDVLHQGVLEGRRSFANLLKYVMMESSSNFGNMFSMAGAALLLPFLPMLPMQILLNNLLYDTSQLTLPGDRVEPESLSAPGRWNIGFIWRFMLMLGPVSSVFDFLTFGLLWGAFHAAPAHFQTGWFVESLLTQTLVIFVIRTPLPLWRVRPALALVASVLGVAAIAVVLPYTRLGALIGLAPLPGRLLLAIAALTLCYLLAARLTTRLFYRLALGKATRPGR